MHGIKPTVLQSTFKCCCGGGLMDLHTRNKQVFESYWICLILASIHRTVYYFEPVANYLLLQIISDR